MVSQRACTGISKSGERCQAPPMLDSDYCFWHDPEHQEDVAKARQAGGARRRREGTVATAYDVGDTSSVEGLKRVHQIAVMDTLSLENSISRNRALGYLLVSQLAVLLAEEKRAWTDGDLEEIGWTRELVVKPNAWKRLMADAEQVIRTAVEAGELEARGAGKKLAVRRASFDAWLGRPVTVYPTWASAYEVLPDDREVHVEADRNTLRDLRRAVEESPIPAEVLRPGHGKGNLTVLIEAMEQHLERGLRIRWAEVVGAEAVIDRIAAEFGGEDPLKPHSREALRRARSLAEKLAAELRSMGREFELAPLDQEEALELKAMLERGGVVFRLG